MVNIAGVEVKNPTAVWTQLVNTRRNVLNKSGKWLSGGWFVGPPGRTEYTMCLANAIRFVTQGNRNQPQGLPGDENEPQMDVAEMVVLAVVNQEFPDAYGFNDIPSFNDMEGRHFEHIEKVLDKAIEMLEPHAKVATITFAHDVMTKEERDEIDQATWEAEKQIWEEYFTSWLDDHEKRGWATFWDELLDCQTEKCKQARELLKR